MQPSPVQLHDLRLHRGERFRDVYDFGASWECDVHVAGRLSRVYWGETGGAAQGLPGAWGFPRNPQTEGLAGGGTMQRGGALDKARGPSSLRRRCGHNLTQGTGHLGYGRHRGDPCLQAVWWVVQPSNPTVTFVIDLNAATQYAPPVSLMY